MHITGFFMPHNQYHHIIILCASPQQRRKILRLPSKYVQLTIPIPFPSNSGILSRETQDFASLLAFSIGIPCNTTIKNYASYKSRDAKSCVSRVALCNYPSLFHARQTAVFFLVRRKILRLYRLTPPVFRVI